MPLRRSARWTPPGLVWSCFYRILGNACFTGPSSGSPQPCSHAPTGPFTWLCTVLNGCQCLHARWLSPQEELSPLSKSSPSTPPPRVTDCDRALLPVSGNSFPVPPLFHRSGAPRPSPIPQRCAPSCLPGSWLPSLFLRQHSLKISAASLLSAEKRLPHYSDMLMSLGPTRTLSG